MSQLCCCSGQEPVPASAGSMWGVRLYQHSSWHPMMTFQVMGPPCCMTQICPNSIINLHIYSMQTITDRQEAVNANVSHLQLSEVYCRQSAKVLLSFHQNRNRILAAASHPCSVLSPTMTLQDQSQLPWGRQRCWTLFTNKAVQKNHQASNPKVCMKVMHCSRVTSVELMEVCTVLLLSVIHVSCVMAKKLQSHLQWHAFL